MNNKCLLKYFCWLGFLCLHTLFTYGQRSISDIKKSEHKKNIDRVTAVTKLQVLRIDSIFRKYDRKDCPGCAVAVIRNNNIIFQRGYGMANLEHSIPIIPSTVFDIASVSKQFTAFAIALLVRRGKISLEDDVRKYVPELYAFDKQITIKHLVYHTSGLRDYGALLMMTGWRMDHPVAQHDFLKIVSRQRSLNYSPGDKFMYSNTNYALLGLIIERVAGMTTAKFLKEEIFVPLGMMNTILRDDPSIIVPHRASNYTPDSSGIFKINYVWGLTKVMGPSSVHSTIGDLAKWDRNFYLEGLGGIGIADLLYTSGNLNSGESSNYGFGLFTRVHKGLKMITHDGAGGGSFVLTRFPDQKFSVAVLCNRYYTSINATMLAEKVADIFLAEKYRDVHIVQPELTTSDEKAGQQELKLYKGIFWMEGSGNKITFATQDGMLSTRYNNENWFPLTYLSKGKFFNKEEGLFYSFTNINADLASVQITVPGTKEVYNANRYAEPVLDSTHLNAYSGVFGSDELNIFWNVNLKDGKLQLTRENFEEKILVPTYKDAFDISYTNETTTMRYLLNFLRDKEGNVNRILVSGGRLDGILFVKNN